MFALHIRGGVGHDHVTKQGSKVVSVYNGGDRVSAVLSEPLKLQTHVHLFYDKWVFLWIFFLFFFIFSICQIITLPIWPPQKWNFDTV